jgi:hypothetical protein
MSQVLVHAFTFSAREDGTVTQVVSDDGKTAKALMTAQAQGGEEDKMHARTNVHLKASKHTRAHTHTHTHTHTNTHTHKIHSHTCKHVRASMRQTHPDTGEGDTHKHT